jgi:hypothetical protein
VDQLFSTLLVVEVVFIYRGQQELEALALAVMEVLTLHQGLLQAQLTEALEAVAVAVVPLVGLVVPEVPVL